MCKDAWEKCLAPALSYTHFSMYNFTFDQHLTLICSVVQLLTIKLSKSNILPEVSAHWSNVDATNSMMDMVNMFGWSFDIMNLVTMSLESIFSVSILYVFDPLLKLWTWCNIRCSLIITHKFHLSGLFELKFLPYLLDPYEFSSCRCEGSRLWHWILLSHFDLCSSGY